MYVCVLFERHTIAHGTYKKVNKAYTFVMISFHSNDSNERDKHKKLSLLLFSLYDFYVTKLNQSSRLFLTHS